MTTLRNRFSTRLCTRQILRVGFVASSTGLAACRAQLQAPQSPVVQRELQTCVATARILPSDSLGSINSQTSTDPLVRISRLVPGGYASMYVAQDGILVLQLADPAHSEETRTALAAEFRVHAADQAASDRKFTSARIEKVSWSLAVLLDWTGYVERVIRPAAARARLMPVGIGMSAAKGRISVSVPSDSAFGWVETILAPSAVPCGMVELSISQPVVPL